MARKAAVKKAAPAPALDGCNVATSGKFAGTTQAALQSRIKELGGNAASSVTPETSFLIATEKDFESKSVKVKAAATHNVPIVSLSWLEECESTGRPQTPDGNDTSTLTWIWQIQKLTRNNICWALLPVLRLPLPRNKRRSVPPHPTPHLHPHRLRLNKRSQRSPRRPRLVTVKMPNPRKPQ